MPYSPHKFNNIGREELFDLVVGVEKNLLIGKCDRDGATKFPRNFRIRMQPLVESVDDENRPRFPRLARVLDSLTHTELRYCSWI
jgi:hypothetical protein